jgi:heat shock 70kDa protein 1/2/6/8
LCADTLLAEDEAATARIHARNSLESYAYSLRNSSSDEKLANKATLGDRTRFKSALNETISWLDAPQVASKEEYERKKEELTGLGMYVHHLQFYLCC